MRGRPRKVDPLEFRKVLLDSETLQEAADRADISRARASQLAKEFGLQRRFGFRRVKRNRKPPASSLVEVSA